MRRRLLAAACLLLVAAGPRHRPPAAALGTATAAPAGDVVMHGPAGPAAEIVAVERAFSARSQEAGAATAFSEFLDADDSRAFMGGPALKGAKAIGAAHADPGRLSWQPREVFASKGGDMGVAWGRYHYIGVGGGASDGSYVTVWRKGDHGWKGVIDMGTPDRDPAG